MSHVRIHKHVRCMCHKKITYVKRCLIHSDYKVRHAQRHPFILGFWRSGFKSSEVACHQGHGFQRGIENVSVQGFGFGVSVSVCGLGLGELGFWA